MQFAADVTPGAPGDPIQGYTWNFGDGTPPVVTDGPIVEHMFETAGDFVVEVTVADGDSVSVLSREVTIREISFSELIVELNRRVDLANADDADARREFARNDTLPWMGRARWGEDQFADTNVLQRRGNTMISLGVVVDGIAAAIESGGRLDGGNTLWATARQLERLVISMRDDIVDADNGIDADNPSIIRADEFITAMQEVTVTVYEHPDTGEAVTFKEIVDDPVGTILARDHFARAFEAFFFVTDAIDPFNAPEFDNFNVPGAGDAEQRVAAADELNGDLHVLLGDMATEMLAYAASPGAVGAQQVRDAKAIVDQLRQLTAQPIAIVCEFGACLSDRDALELALGLSDLALALFRGRSRGRLGPELAERTHPRHQVPRRALAPPRRVRLRPQPPPHHQRT
ncbi:MAG: PKD domain-containing protein [Planctomycetota bacterium]|jgi:hypothetical protein